MEGLKGLIIYIFDRLDTPFFIVSYPELRFFFSNRAGCGLFFNHFSGGEISGDGLTGKTFDEVFAQSDAAAALREVLERAGRGKKTARLEELCVGAGQGEERIFQVVCFPLPGDFGKESVDYIAGYATDITRQLEAAEQERLLSGVKETLEEKESLLSVLNVLPFAVVFSSMDGTVRYVNDSFFWLTGYERKDILGLSRDQAEKMLLGKNCGGEKSAPGSSPVDANPERDTFIISKFNQCKPVELYRIPLVKMGRVDGTVTVIREKTAEPELARLTAALRGVLDGVLAAVVITDGDQNIRACSKSCLEIFELEEGEIIGRPLDAVTGLLKAQIKVLSSRMINGIMFATRAQASITTRSQKCKTILINSTPLFSSRGEFNGMVLVGSDMTSFLEKQEKLFENERLAVIGQLTSSIAHEIKNPLTVISGFAEVTKSKILKISGNESLKESMLYYQQEIIDNSRNMNRLIVDLLHLARPKKSERVNINLLSTLDKICNTIAPYALQRNVTLIKNLMAADLEMAVDPVQIGQVLMNLCNNAIQAMADGGTLSITAQRGDGCLIIQVSDDGCGIKPEDLNKLGTPFFTTKAEGTGLGLSVTYSIIREYGGRVEVESEVGKGSTFKVYLPLGEQQ